MKLKKKCHYDEVTDSCSTSYRKSLFCTLVFFHLTSPPFPPFYHGILSDTNHKLRLRKQEVIHLQIRSPSPRFVKPPPSPRIQYLGMAFNLFLPPPNFFDFSTLLMRYWSDIEKNVDTWRVYGARSSVRHPPPHRPVSKHVRGSSLLIFRSMAFLDVTYFVGQII